jgi:phosphoribosylformylglycinamidine synthase
MTEEPNPPITDDLVAEHGLKPDEYERVKEILGREPNLVELGIFSVMWSEHCSYKSSKKWLKTLPTDGPRVIQGPGENAGVVDIGDGQAAVFKIESHNHPSFIEPYQGAATGVGGILRDVFTMGARPVCNLNALRFGDPAFEKTRMLVSGVVAGIGGYGNCVGVPTIAGEVTFHETYNRNILVNAMTVGLAESDKIFYAKATGAGNPVVYVGSKTGRDGIHGATMASASFDEEGEDQRPTVQVGDPFTEKLLIEACLELMATDAIIGIQDMGAAGLTSSSFEMASKGGAGVELDLDQVPMRETGMTGYELMLSESQERMLMVLKPGREDEARRIFEKWDLDFAVIGKLTDTGRMVLRKNGGALLADLPIDPLAESAPEYDRPWEPTPAAAAVAATEVPAPADPCATLAEMLATPNMASRRWIWEQYDHMVMADTVQRPGGDAGVVRVHGSNKGLAVTVDCTPRYCLTDPVEGGKQAVAESWRNLTAVGAEPLAVTDNMNFGNPEKPRVMGQFVGAVEGMREACTAFGYPVVSGNVSLYNETGDTAVLPTPTIGGLGLLPDIGAMATVAFKEADEAIVLIGETAGHLGASLYLQHRTGREDGAPPPVDLAAEKRNGDFVRERIRAGAVTASHDVSDGGLLVAIAEMAMAAQGKIGAEVTVPEDLSGGGDMAAICAWLYGEDQGRYVLTVPEAGPLLKAAREAGVPAAVIGKTGGKKLKLSTGHTISIKDLRAAHEGWLPDYMTRTG